MSLGASDYFTIKQLKTIEKIGDIIMPANGKFPAFSTTGCIENIDIVMSPTHPEDLTALRWLLNVLHFIPSPLMRQILNLIGLAPRMPNWLAPPFRLLNMSLNGIIFSLYYSNQTRASYQGSEPFDAIDCHIHCEPDPQIKTQTSQ